MSNNAEKYYFGNQGDIFIRPLHVRLKGTFSSSGAVVTMSTTRRQSHPGALCTGSGGSYTVTGLPTGLDYHVVGIHLGSVAGTALVTQCSLYARNAAAGTLSFQTRQSSDGVATAPPDNATFELTLDVESGG